MLGTNVNKLHSLTIRLWSNLEKAKLLMTLIENSRFVLHREHQGSSLSSVLKESEIYGEKGRARSHGRTFYCVVLLQVHISSRKAYSIGVDETGDIGELLSI